MISRRTTQLAMHKCVHQQCFCADSRHWRVSCTHNGTNSFFCLPCLLLKFCGMHKHFTHTAPSPPSPISPHFHFPLLPSFFSSFFFAHFSAFCPASVASFASSPIPTDLAGNTSQVQTLRDPPSLFEQCLFTSAHCL